MTELEIADAAISADRNLLAVWERWWTALDGTPGEIVWDADAGDLAADLEQFAASFDERLPVVDFGCGDGRQTRFLARHFTTVLGIDISPAAIDRARAAANPPNVSYRVLDARDPDAAARLHRELGDANVYTRGVMQALPVADRPHAVESMAALLSEQGTLFAKELPPEAGAYFQQVVARHGLSAGLERVMRLIPPGQITEAELAGLFGAERFEVIATGTSHIHTVNALPDGERIKVPAIYALIRPRDRVSAASRAIGRVDAEDAELHALKQGALAVWSAGDYPALARMHADSGIATARRAGAGPGVRLLDVACGDGNVAISAARAGASVIALDLTPRMLEHGRARAARENVAIEWVLGDAEELPFADEGFDAVTSNFGAVFAPRHAVVAAELARVCRPGGRIVMTAWAPDGFNERLAAVAGAYLPQPEVRQPAVLWADEQHACECFAPTGVKLRFERHVARARFRSVEHALEVGEHAFGPVVLARERLIAEGVWDELRAAVGAHYARWAKPVDGGIEIEMEYMAITGQKPGHSTLGGER